MADDITIQGYGGEALAQPVYGTIAAASGSAINVPLPFTPSIVEVAIRTGVNDLVIARCVLALGTSATVPYEWVLSESSGTLNTTISTTTPVISAYAGTDGKEGFTIGAGYLAASDVVLFIAWP